MSDIVPSDSQPSAELAAGVIVPPVLDHAPVEAPGAYPAGPRKLEVRIWSTFIFASCAAMYGVALYLTPSHNGYGSHEQLGLPPCGFLKMTGCPCPTCGCTTAVCFFAHGNPLASIVTQPFGFAVALLGFVLLPLTFWGMVAGNWKGPSMFWISFHWRYWTYGGIAVLLGAWVYKIIAVQTHLVWPW